MAEYAAAHPSDRTTRLEFSGGRSDRGPRAWIAYRRADCLSLSDEFQGGSAAGIVFARCDIRRDRTRLHDVQQLAKALNSG